MKNNPEPAKAETLTPAPNIKKIRIPPIILGIIIGVFLTSGSVFAFVLYIVNSPSPQTPYNTAVNFAPTPTPDTSLAPSPLVSPTPLPSVDINPGSIAWLDFPKSVKIDAFKSPDENGYIDGSNIIYKDIKYLHVANFADGSKLINAIVPSEGMGIWYHVDHFLQSSDGRLYFLTILPYKKDSYSNETPTSVLLPKIKFASLAIDGIQSPDVIETDKGKYSLTNYFMDSTISFTELKNPVLVATTQYGRIYAVYTDAGKSLNLSFTDGIYDRKFWLRLKDDTVKAYQLSLSFITDDKIPQITWSDGTKNTQVFAPGFGGKCGINQGSLFKNTSPIVTKLVQSGQNNQGQPVYTISDLSSPIFPKIYEGLDPSTRPDMDTFMKRKNHFLWQDSLNDWWLFISEENKIQAECAKPVIYLYPAKDTKVSVRVGAAITKSEPQYPPSGWTVIAHPNGLLDYQQKTFPSLFWEGTGFGIYNDHLGEGVVVSQEDLIPTLKSHLSRLGLNSRESADFMEFWTSKLPRTPYVRLTWLNTADMDQLAPLQVNPRPDTSIRIFLEFEGLNAPISLKPQKLTSTPRRGFTLVEWGGLLRK